MRVFFSNSVSRDRSILPVSQDIAYLIEKLGHEILNRHLVDEKFTKDSSWDHDIDAKKLYKDELKRLQSADVLITEATTPSFGGGFFIDEAIKIKKPLLTLHYGDNPKNATIMLRGRDDINLQMYTEENIQGVLSSFLSSIEQI